MTPTCQRIAMTTDANALECEDWRFRFRRDGYAHFRNLCPEAAANSARLAIDHNLVMNYDPARQVEYDHRSYCPELRGSPPLMALLLGNGIPGKLDEAIGFNRLRYDGGQIALRKAGNAPEPHPPQPHIDGLPTLSMVSPPTPYSAISRCSSGYISVRCGPSSPGTSLSGRGLTTFWKLTSASTDPRHCGTACPAFRSVNRCN
jgi:hypothetical protein